MLKTKKTTSDNPDFQKLVALLDQDLRKRDGDEHAFFAQFNKLHNIKHAVLATVGDVPVGCGAFKAYDTHTAEIKRMFVLPEYRGQRIAEQVLLLLESWAASLGYTSCQLETGLKQPEAIRLYTRCGYTIIPNFGPYVGVESSVCMHKSLVLELPTVPS